MLPCMKRGATQNRRSTRGCSSVGRAPALQFSGLMRCAHQFKRRFLRSEDRLVRCSCTRLAGAGCRRRRGRAIVSPCCGRPSRQAPTCRHTGCPAQRSARTEPGASSSSAITLTATQPCVFAEQEGGSQRYSEGQRQEQGEGSAEANADKDDCGDQEGQRVR